MSEGTFVPQPIYRHELGVLIAAELLKSRIAGLREAAEIIDNLKAVEEIIPAVEPTEDDLGYPAIKTRRLPSIRTAKAAILARIAELEKTDGS